MYGQNKEDDASAVCKSHSARSDKELYRVCPSKLSKRELEDLYFTLLENNLELKKINNIQQDKIKLLSTKVQRMMATQKNALAKDQKDCCSNSKALMNEHKESIAELKRSNERMSERIRVLNTRLCSAKQFLRRSPPACNSKCTKCSILNARGSNMSVLNTKRSNTNLKTSVSSQCLDKDDRKENVLHNVVDQSYKWFTGVANFIATSTVATTTNNNDKKSLEKLCDENKCRTQIEELKQKIVEIQEELFKTHEEYTVRVTRLEEDMVRVQSDNQRLRNEQAAAEYQLQQRLLDAELLGQRLRVAEAKQGELETQLTIEKRKVTELETNARAADMTRQVAATIERLSNTSQMKTRDDKLQLESISSPYFTPRFDGSPSRIATPPRILDGFEKTDPKASDDSGYMEPNKSREEDKNKELKQIDMDILDRISLFQGQMEDLKVITSNVNNLATQKHDKPKKNTSEHKSIDSRMLNKKALDRIPKDPEITIEEKIHFAQTKTCQDVDSNLDIEMPRRRLSQRSDNHNSLQIPGPLPVDTLFKEAPSKRKEQSVAAKFKQLLEHKSRRSTTKNSYSDASTSQSKEGDAAKKTFTDSVSMETERPKSDKDKKDGQTFTDLFQTDIERKSPDNKLPFLEKATQNIDAINKEESEGSTKVQRNAAVETDEVPEKGPALVFCERHSRICGCRTAARRDVSVFRTCSGTLRFKTTDTPTAATNLKLCGCPAIQNDPLKPAGTQTDVQQPAGPSKGPAEIGTSPFDELATNDRATTTGPFNRPQNTSVIAPKTTAPFNALPIHAPYEAPEQAPAAPLSHRSRATSPDNTDAEISSLTDLPSEKDTKSPRAPLSPGEDKATTTNTYTDSYTQPVTDYGSLSEGELPSPFKAKKLSTAEAKVNFAINDPVSQRMEEALQAVSLELARCRELLDSQRPSQSQRRPSSREVGLMTEVNQGAPLKRKPATPCIGDTFAPKCIFTLHIGTVVLSDEAMINSRDMSLMLMWKFFEHEMAMTRLRAGRVVLFDFSTEYDVKITPEFINYLKHEEMPLVICELDQQGDAFATSSLPLRDALLHANRRADMSLALIAGPKLKRARATRDKLDTSDEIGVLDLWCSLRVDPALLSSVNQAVGKTLTPPSTARPSQNTALCNNLNSINEAGATVDDVSADFLFNRGFGSAAARQKNSSIYELDKYRSRQRSAASQNPNEFFKKSMSSQQNKVARDSSRTSFLNKESAIQRNSPQMQSTATVHTIIKNEVPVKIKSAVELKKALDEIPGASKHPRNTEDNVSLTHSPINAWRGLLSRRLLPRHAQRRSARLSSVVSGAKINSEKQQDGSWTKFTADAKQSMAMARSPMSSGQAERPPPELTKALAGSYRMLNTSKRSAISRDEDEPGLGTEDRHREIHVTILWLALNEECDAMANPRVQRLYVAYEFMGRSGADMETPVSLPKPKEYADKCTFNFTKTFHLYDCDIPVIGHMAKCRSNGKSTHDPRDCIVFTVISEPLEDPMGFENCQDIGYAYLYLGDLLAYSGGNISYTEVVPVHSARAGVQACGVLALRLDGLDVVRRCLLLAISDSILKIN